MKRMVQHGLPFLFLWIIFCPQNLWAQTFSNLPFFESFERTWTIINSGGEVPSSFWKNTTSSGIPCWSRNTDGYGSTYCAGFNNKSPNGFLDLYLDFSGNTECKVLSFYYFNLIPDPPSHLSPESSAGKLNGYLSEDGGITFKKTLFKLNANKTGWSKIVIDLGPIENSQTVIRFEGLSGYMPWSNILLDNVSVYTKTVSEYISANLPFLETFDQTWKVYDSIYPSPSNSWKTTPDSNSFNIWKKYLNSARFYDFNNNSSTSATLDLYIDFSKYSGKKFLSFRNFIDQTIKTYHFTNFFGYGILTVYISTDAGKTYTELYNTTHSNFESPVFVDLQGFDLPSIIRFKAQSIGIHSFCDIILDDVKIGCVKADFLADTLVGAVPLDVNFTNQSFGDSILSKWDFNNDGIIDGIGQYQSFRYNSSGLYSVKLIATKNEFSDTLIKSGYIRVYDLPKYSSLPFQEDFDNIWFTRGSLRDSPSENWINRPSFGNNAWSREDDGVARGAWKITNNHGSELNGTHYACFQSSTTDLGGSLDLFIDFSSYPGKKGMSFWYKNLISDVKTISKDSLKVYLSIDGGNSFETLLLSLGENSAWEKYIINLDGINTAHGVIRFEAMGDPEGSSDILIDNLKIGSPIANFTLDAANDALPLTIKLKNESIGNIISSKWDFNNDNIIDATDPNPSYTFNSIGPQSIKLIVSDLIGSDSIIKNNCINVNAYASIPFVEDFESEWINRDYHKDVPSIFWKSYHYWSDNFWASDSDSQIGQVNWQKYSPTGANGTNHSARSFSSRGGRDHLIDLYIDFSSLVGKKILSFWYINSNGYDSLKVSLSNDGGKTFNKPFIFGAKQVWTKFNINLGYQNSKNTVLRFASTPGFDFGSESDTSDIGLDEIRIDSFMSDFSADVTSGNIPLTVHFFDQTIGNPVRWEWDFNNDNLPDDYCPNPTYTFDSAGEYSIQMLSSTVDMVDSIRKYKYIIVSEAIQKEEKDSVNVLVYPVPTSGIINIKIYNPENKPLTLELLDNNGRKVIPRQTTVNNLFQINLIEYEDGIYYLHSTCGDKVFINKIIKK